MKKVLVMLIAVAIALPAAHLCFAGEGRDSAKEMKVQREPAAASPEKALEARINASPEKSPQLSSRDKNPFYGERTKPPRDQFINDTRMKHQITGD